MNKSTKYGSTVQMLTLCQFGGVGPRTLDALMAHFGSLDTIMTADLEQLRDVPGLPDSSQAHIRKAIDRQEEAARLLVTLKERGVEVTSRFDQAYDHLLFELNDPPNILYHRGTLPEALKKSVAVVGAENATGGGLGLTALLTKAFCRGDVQIISTLSGGIDVAAHLASRAVNGQSFAVLDRGLDQIVADWEVPLADDIVKTGGLISEYPQGTEPSSITLEAANRIVVGLSRAVVVTELYHDSTRALDLLEFSANIGKMSFAVADARYGSLFDDAALARALKCGAILIESADQIDDIIRSLV